MFRLVYWCAACVLWLMFSRVNRCAACVLWLMFSRVNWCAACVLWCSTVWTDAPPCALTFHHVLQRWPGVQPNLCARIHLMLSIDADSLTDEWQFGLTRLSCCIKRITAVTVIFMNWFITFTCDTVTADSQSCLADSLSSRVFSTVYCFSPTYR
jgi:hypothetical protein